MDRSPQPLRASLIGEVFLISQQLCCMLYDFCNAFPTLLHEWLWLVLNVLCIPKPLLKVVKCLCTSIKAFSSCIGDGSFLFEVFGGVRTGCRLSSILFLLCCNHCIFFMDLICDGPSLSVTSLFRWFWLCSQISCLTPLGDKRRFLSLLPSVLAWFWSQPNVL